MQLLWNGLLFIVGAYLADGGRIPEDRALAGGLVHWDSLPALAQTHYPILPARWLVRDRYDNVENLRGYESNVAFLSR